MRLPDKIMERIYRAREVYEYANLHDVFNDLILGAGFVVDIDELEMPRKHPKKSERKEHTVAISQSAFQILREVQRIYGLSMPSAIEALLETVTDPWSALKRNFSKNINQEVEVSG